MSYQSVSLLDTQANSTVIWTLPGPLSSDTIAGLLVGLQCMINRNVPTLVSEANREPRGLLALALQIVDYTGKISDIDLIVDRIPFIKDYLEYRAVPYASLSTYYVPTSDENVSNGGSSASLTDGYYGWWIKDSADDTYSLYRFQTNDFVQGFISAFDIFTMEFRDYIAGPPFHTEVGLNGNKRNIFYNIEGYDIQPLVQNRRDPAPTGAFYANSYEQYNRTGFEPDHITDEIDTEYPRDFQ